MTENPGLQAAAHIGREKTKSVVNVKIGGVGQAMTDTPPPAWAMQIGRTIADKHARSDNLDKTGYTWCVLEIARALADTDKAARADERGRLVSESTIKLVAEYDHVHLMLDGGEEWYAVRNYLKANGWALISEPYGYWLAYTQQRMILALGEIAAAIRKGDR